MANCKYCDAEIFWAFHVSWNRWQPIEPESITGNETLTEDGGGVFLELYHRRHRCLQGRQAWRSAREQREEPRPPPRSSPPPSRTGSWAHATLFVTSDAPPEVIRAAYRALSLLYHPDHGGDADRMIELNKAYETLFGKNRPV